MDIFRVPFLSLVFSSLFSLFPFPLFSEKISYSWPVKATPVITGSFGEFRYFYFHMGMDFSTDGQTNMPVLAIANGKITRVMTNRYSIGNAVFLTHKDGITSKYGHLNRFSPKIINALPAEIQLLIAQRRDFDFELKKPIFFRKGDTIAYSGDTGAGPAHLHLELFNKDGVYFNPAVFGINHNPNGKITLYSVTIRPVNHKSFIRGRNQPLELGLVSDGSNKYRPADGSPIEIQGKVYFQIDGHELSGPVNKIGFQSMSVSLNDNELQEINFDSIKKNHQFRSALVMDNSKSNMSGKPFSYFLMSRYDNGLLGYKYGEKEKGSVEDTDLKPEEDNVVLLKIRGLSGTAKVTFKLKQDYSDYTPQIKEPTKTNVNPEEFSSIQSKDKNLELYFPAYSVFSPVNIEIEEHPNSKVYSPGMKMLSNIYTIKPFFREFHLGFDLYLKMNNPEEKPEKVSLYRVSSEGVIYSCLDGDYIADGKFLKKSRLKTAGSFVLLKDESPPVLYSSGVSNNSVVSGKNFKIKFVVYDIGSGVTHTGLQVKIDGEEAWADYDPESGLREVFHPAEKIYAKGKHTIEAIATDRVGNSSNKYELHYHVK